MALQHIAPPAQTSARRHERTHRRRMKWADSLTGLCFVSVAAAVSLALSAGTFSSISNVADAVTAAGIAAGLIGTDLILVMLLLAARTPLVDRVFGHDAALTLHSRLGKPSLYFLLAHAVLLVIGYGMSDGMSPLAEVLSLLEGKDLFLAGVSVGLMIVVVVTSVTAIRHQLSYEVWQLIHLLSYVAVAIAIPHQLSAGQILADGTWQRWYWICLYAVAFGSIVWFRCAIPVIVSFRHRIVVESVVPIADGVFSIHLHGRNLERLHVIGGQYAIWRFWSARTWWHAHPISFSAMPTENSMRITVRELGNGTSRLAGLHSGTAVTVEGPYGIHTSVARTSPKLAIIAAGIGVTPARALLEDSELLPGETTVVMRGSELSHAYLWDEIADLTHDCGGTFYTMVGHRPPGRHTWLSESDLARGVTLQSIFPDLLQSDLYICGPAAWTDLIVADARRSGLREEQIHTESFER